MNLVAPDLPDSTGAPGDNRVSGSRSEKALTEVRFEVRVDGEFASKHTMAFRVRVTHTMLVLVVGLLVAAPEHLHDLVDLLVLVGSPLLNLFGVRDVRAVCHCCPPPPQMSSTRLTNLKRQNLAMDGLAHTRITRC